MGRGLLAVCAARPCFDRLGFQKLHQRGQVLLLVIGLQRVIIGAAILLIDDGGWIVVLLEFAGALTSHNVAAFIIGSLRQRTVYDTDQLDGQRLFCNDFVL